MVTEAERSAVQRRVLLKETAEARGKPFSRSEAIRFLGGGTQVSLLRSARRQGLTIATLEEEQRQALEQPLTKAPQVDLDAATLRKRTRGDIFRKELKIPVFVGPGGRIPVSEVKKGLRELGLPGKIVAEFVPQTPLELAAIIGIGALAGAPGLTGVITKGTISALGTATALDPDLPAETRIAGGLIAVSPLIPELIKFGKKKLPTFEEFKASQKQLLKTKKGQAQFQQLETFFKKKGKKKSDIQKALDDASNRLTRRIEVKGNKKILRDTTQGEKVEFLRRSLERTRLTKDSKLRKKQIEGIVKFTKSELGEAATKSLFKDLIAQEGFATPQFKATLKREVSVPFVVPSPTTPEVKVPSLEEAVKVSRFDFTGLSEGAKKNIIRVDKARSKNDQRIVVAKSKDAQRKELFQSNTNQNKLKNNLRINTQKQLDKLRQLQSLRLNTQVDQASVQRQILQQRLVVRQAQAQLKRFSQTSAQRLRPRVKTRFKIPKPFPKLKPTPKKKKVIPLIKVKGKVTPFIKQKPSRENKFKKLGKQTTLKKASKKLYKELGSSLRASGFLQDARGKRIKPRSLPREFRFSKNKKTPKIIVERRKFRITKGTGEVSEIQRAKKIAKPNLKSTKMIKVKKRR